MEQSDELKDSTTRVTAGRWISGQGYSRETGRPPGGAKPIGSRTAFGYPRLRQRRLDVNLFRQASRTPGVTPGKRSSRHFVYVTCELEGLPSMLNASLSLAL